MGLLLDSPILPRFAAEITDQIRASSFASLSLVVLNRETTDELGRHSPPFEPPVSLLGLLRDRDRRRKLLFGLYQRWDRKNVVDDDPLTPVDCSTLLGDAPTIIVLPESRRFVHRFPADTIARIREFDLDVLIRFGFNIIRGEILQAARFGVWSYHHGDNDHYRGGPACFWEVRENSPLSGVVLQVLTEVLDAGTVLCKCVVATEPGFSMARNRPRPYWAASTFMIRKLRELHAYGWDYVQARVIPPHPYQGRKKIYRIPTNWEMVRWLAPAVTRKALRRLARPSRTPHWRLAIRRSQVALVDQGPSPDLRGFRTIESPAGRFYADPFLIQHAGKTWLFFEDFDYATRRGRISAAELGADGQLGDPIRVLERPYHLSYPCVFRDGDELFMIPETGSNNTIELYRCREFPERWTLEKPLFHGRSVDTTVWIEDGKYWFFVTLVEPRARATELWLFSASSLTGAWTPHPANPISSDVRNSRGAGALFRHDGRIVRPSQDCSGRYGRSFTFNEITALTPDRYDERPLVIVGAMKGCAGTHTYTRAGHFEVIDSSAMVRPATVAPPRGRLSLPAPLAHEP